MCVPYSPETLIAEDIALISTLCGTSPRTAWSSERILRLNNNGVMSSKKPGVVFTDEVHESSKQPHEDGKEGKKM
eukprot:1345487-Amorphochlora_amoeboformis.AAC.2